MKFLIKIKKKLFNNKQINKENSKNLFLILISNYYETNFIMNFNKNKKKLIKLTILNVSFNNLK